MTAAVQVQRVWMEGFETASANENRWLRLSLPR